MKIKIWRARRRVDSPLIFFISEHAIHGVYVDITHDDDAED
jgi:hypothetical protein